MIDTGKGSYRFRDPRGGDRFVTIHTYRAATYAPKKPIVFSLHGRRRNGADYRDFWVDEAERRGLLVVAPEFDDDQYPHPEAYNFGAMRRADGSAAPREDWLFPLYDAIFEDVRQRAGATRERYFMYGHSAGAQVVHRLVTFGDTKRIELAVAANAGAYCMPVRDEPFPFGLDGAPLGDDALRRVFARPMILLLGDRDIDPAAEHLPKEPEAMRQGPHRFARGHRYLAVARREAQRLGVACPWRIAIAPGIAHDGGGMVPFAARALFDTPAVTTEA